MRGEQLKKGSLNDSKANSEIPKRTRMKRRSESPKTQMIRTTNTDIDEAKSKSQQKVNRNSKAITK